MNVVLGGKTPIFLFAEKPAIAPPVFVFQKDKGQKVRGRYVLPSHGYSALFSPQALSPQVAWPRILLPRRKGPVALGYHGTRLRWGVYGQGSEALL